MPLPPRTEPVWAPPQTAWLPNDDADKDTDDLFRNLLNLHIDHQLPHSNQPLRPAVQSLTNSDNHSHQPVHALRDHIPSDTDVLHVPDIHPEADALHMFASAPMSVTATAPVPLRPRAHVDYDLRRMRARAPSASPSHTPSPSSSPPPSLSAPRIKNELYKTEICRSFAETAGFCKYGSKCQFAHGEQELRPVRRHPRYKTKLCRNFVTTGTCPYDARCRFIHASDLAYAPLPVNQRRDTFSPVGVNTSVAISMAPAPMAVTPVPVTAVPVTAAPDKYADALQVFLNGPRYELEAQRDDRVAENGYDANANLFTDYATHNVERFEGAPLERLPVSRRMFANNGAQTKLPSLVPRTAVPMPMPPQRRLPVFRNMPHNDDQ